MHSFDLAVMGLFLVKLRNDFKRPPEIILLVCGHGFVHQIIRGAIAQQTIPHGPGLIPDIQTMFFDAAQRLVQNLQRLVDLAFFLQLLRLRQGLPQFLAADALQFDLIPQAVDLAMVIEDGVLGADGLRLIQGDVGLVIISCRQMLLGFL